MKVDIRDEIRNLKIFSKRLIHSAISGDYAAAFKGTGFEMDQIREYVSGDDVRFVDWNASAKTGTLMVKECIPERDRTVIFAIDCSGSNVYSSKEDLKRDLVLRATSALTFIANNSNDRVGAVIFDDKVHQWFAPERGEAHVARILESVLSRASHGRGTSLSECMKFLIDLRKKNSILFFISDWVGGVNEQSSDGYAHYERLLKLTACEYDMVAVRVMDNCESYFPDVGIVCLEDTESHESIMIDSHDKELSNRLFERFNEQRAIFERCGIDVLDLITGDDIARSFAAFFCRRIGRQV